MFRVKLTAYTLRIRDELNEFLRLDGQNGGIDFPALFNQYIEERMQELSHIANAQQLLQVREWHSLELGVHGIFLKGEYGLSGELYNIEQERVIYEKLDTDADMLRYYFHIRVPAQSDRAILVLQRFGTGGVKGLFEYDFRTWLTNQNPNYRLEINPIIPNDLIRQYLRQGRIISIKYIKSEIPEDIADRDELNLHRQEGEAQLIVKVNRGGNLPVGRYIEQVLDGQLEVPDFLPLRELEHENAKIEIELGGITRTLDLLHPERFIGSIDVTNDIDRREGGHPNMASLNTLATEYINHILG